MPYIGKIPATGAFQKCDALNASATADYTLQVDSTNVVPESVNHMIVSLNGVIQEPGATGGFTVSGSTLSFASALTSNDSIDFVILLGNVLDIGTPSDDTVSTAKIQDDAVTSDKLGTGDMTFPNGDLIFGTAGKGVCLGVTSNTDANTLDDYEEGLHTVALTDTAGDVTSIALNSSFNQLAYTKIGRLVHISGTIVISSFSGSWNTGILRMTLPFTTADLTDQGGKSIISVGTYNVDYTTGTAPFIQTAEGAATADFYASGDNETNGKCQPSNSAQFYIGGSFIAA